MIEAYLKILDSVSCWYGKVKQAFPEEVPCARGCRDCCVGFFDITALDVALLREGMAKLDPLTRAAIGQKAEEALARLRTAFPELGADLAGWSEERVEALCAWSSNEACPALGAESECQLYEYRPLTCRLHGAPIVDHCGAVIQAEGCRHCTLRPELAPTLAFDELVQKEHALLEANFGEQAHDQYLIAQALVNPNGKEMK